MKSIIWASRTKLPTSGQPQEPLEDSGRSKTALPIVDKAAFVVLAAGLIALGGLLFAVGLALLLTLVAGGLLVGGAALTYRHLFGRRAARLGPGEIPADAVVLAPIITDSRGQTIQGLGHTPDRAFGRAPRAD